MAVREFLIPFALVIALSLLNLVSFAILGTMGYIAWIVLEIVWYFTKGSLTLRDVVVKTLVVNEAK
jgi:nitrate reductase NapE component